MGLSKELQERWKGMLHDPDKDVQMRALTEIGRAHSLVRKRPSPLADIKLGTGNAVTKFEGEGLPTTLRDSILEKLSSEDPYMRAGAVLALIHWRDEATLKALKKALDDPAVDVRLAAIQAVVETAPEELMDELVKVAKQDDSEIVRAKAVDAIKWFMRSQGLPETGAVRTRGDAVGHLAQVLEEIRREDKSSYVRFVAGT